MPVRRPSANDQVRPHGRDSRRADPSTPTAVSAPKPRNHSSSARSPAGSVPNDASPSSLSLVERDSVMGVPVGVDTAEDYQIAACHPDPAAPFLPGGSAAGRVGGHDGEEPE
jgi:hypothetical protein